MISGIMVVVLALSAQPADNAGASSVATIVVPTGLDDDDVKRLHARINAQVAAAGGRPMALARALEVKDECLDDPACARAVLRAADAPWLLWVDALRAGPKVQIDARLLDADGRVVAEGGGVVDVDDVFRGSSAVPADVLAPLRTTPVVTNAKSVVPAPERSQPPTALENPPPPLAIAGVAVATGGLLVSVVSLALLPTQFAVIEDPTSLGIEKETAARVMVPTLISTAVGGVVVGGIGGAVAFIAAE